MLLRGIDFPPVFNAAGARAFFGEGYRADRLWGPLRPSFAGCGLTAKTTTLFLTKGNMPSGDDGITPVEMLPRCIYVDFFKGIMLNAVGLSGPGAEALLRDGRWQSWSEPFFVSFSVSSWHLEGRLEELEMFVKLLKEHLPDFRSPVGLEFNISCPNIRHADSNAMIFEVPHFIDQVRCLNLPLQFKFNALADMALVADVCSHPECDAVVLSNTIPWRALSNWINWDSLFGSDEVSPLKRRGFSDGGLSGWPLLDVVCDRIAQLRACGFQKPIWACGGIDSKSAVEKVARAGATGIHIGCVKSLRPWRVPGIIRRAHELFD